MNAESKVELCSANGCRVTVKVKGNDNECGWKLTEVAAKEAKELLTFVSEVDRKTP